MVFSVGSGANGTRSRFVEVIGVSKILIIIGLVLTLIFTIPLFGILILYEATLIYRDRRERPDAKPLSKDEWKIM